jgi:hypothetical protein
MVRQKVRERRGMGEGGVKKPRNGEQNGKVIRKSG